MKTIRDKWCDKEITDLDYIRHLEKENEELKEPKTCEWVKDRSGEVYELPPVFYTQCGGSFVFSECGIKENKFLFCPFCGGSINEPKANG